MGDGYGPILVAKQKFTKEEVARRKIAVPGTMTSAFLALQLWLGKPAKEFNHVVVPFDQIFMAVRSGQADVGLIIHEGQLTYQNEGLVLCEDSVLVGRENDGLPCPRRQRHSQAVRIVGAPHDFRHSHGQHPLQPRPRVEAVQHALQYAAKWAANSRTSSWECT